MRIVPLDAVRGAAAFSVAIPHFFMAKNYFAQDAEFISIIAVEVFFILSGFVLAPQLFFCFHNDTYRNTRIFYARRWIRTIPPYLFALFIISWLYHETFSRDFYQYLVFVRNLFVYTEQNDYFFTAWSLAIEEWFYVVFPLILMLKIKRSPIYAACLFVAALLVTKLLLIVLYPDALIQIRRIAALRLDAIAFGFLLYAAISAFQSKYPAVTKKLSALGILVFGLAVYATLLSISVRPAVWKDVAFIYFAPLFGCSIVALAYCFRNEKPSNTIAARLSIYAGRISYTVYLFHLPLILALRGKRWVNETA